MPFNKEEAWREEQAERMAIEIHLRQNGETPQSIPIVEAPEPKESNHVAYLISKPRTTFPFR